MSDSMTVFTVNGEQYRAKDLDFNFMAYLDKCGVETTNVLGPAAITCFFSFCSGLSEEKAGKEISNHVIANHGEMPNELIDVYKSMLSESDFFRALTERAEEQNSKEKEPSNTEADTKKRTKKTATE